MRAVFFASALVACSVVPVRPLTPASTLKIHAPPEVVEAAQYAAVEWQKLTRGRRQIQIVSNPNTADARVVLVHESQAEHASDGAPVCGYYRESTIALVTGRGCDRQAVMLHETGHALGISGHVDRPGAVMHEWTTAHKLTAADEWLCVREGVCAQ